jgi:hypothetical protein
MAIIDDLAKGATAGVFSGITGIIQVIAGAITGKTPLTAEQQTRLLEQAATLEAAAKTADAALLQGQIDVDKIEAASSDPFQRRWRPAVGWVCVCGLAYQFLICPIFPWCIKIVALLTKHSVAAVPLLPPLDSATLMPLLFGILGLGAMRTFEKVKGSA